MTANDNVLGKASGFLGFKRPSNLILYIILAGALFFFTLLRVRYLSFDGVFCNVDAPAAAPGECYWYRQTFYKIGIVGHLACVLPAGFLAVFQFVPAIRHRYMLFHRISGSLIIILVLLGNIGAVIISSRVFGGPAATQGVTITACIMTSYAILQAYYNIKIRLQIDQHRAWMLRGFSYWGHIITMRIILQCAVRIVSQLPHPLYETRFCTEMETVAGRDFLLSLHPECGPGYPGSATPGYFSAKANWYSEDPFEVIASIGATFGMSAWMALAIHAILVEIYLVLTPREAERLRQVSAERQRANGYPAPGKMIEIFDTKSESVEPYYPSTDGRQIVDAEGDRNYGTRETDPLL